MRAKILLRMDTAVLALFGRHPDGMSLPDILAEFVAQGLTVDQASIFRAVQRLLTEGHLTVVRRANSLDSGAVIKVYGRTVSGKAESNMRVERLANLLGTDIPLEENLNAPEFVAS